MFWEDDDDLASSVVAPPDGVWGGYMKIGDLASYSSKRESQSYDRFMLRFRESGPGTYTLDGEGKAGTNTYKLTGEAKASDGGFNLTLTRIYGLAPSLPAAPRRRSKAPPPAPKRASTRSSGETLADFDGNGGAKARLNGREYAAFWRKASGVDDLDVDAWVKREADAYREANNLGESERATRCAEHVYEKRRDLFEGQFANPVYVISDRLCHYLDARSERTATDVTAAATDEAPAPAPAPAPVARAPPAAAPSAGDAVAATIDRFLGQAAAFALDGVVQDLSSDMSGVAAALLARSVPLSQLALGHLTLSCLDLCMLPVKVSVAGRTHLFHAPPGGSGGRARARHSRRGALAVPVHPAPPELLREALAREPRRLVRGPYGVHVAVQLTAMAARRRLEAGQLFIIPNLAADALQPLPVVVLRQAFARGLEPALPEHILANVAHFLLVGEHGTTAPKWGAVRARKM